MARFPALLLFLGAASVLSVAVLWRGAEAAASVAYTYTPAQAVRGKAIFGAHCAICHGDDMDGKDEAPSLTGPRFDSHWRNRPADLYTKVKLSMPQDDPGSLTVEQATDVVAAILQANKVPSASGSTAHR